MGVGEFDLRWSLLLLGAVIVAGVFAYNRIQERRFRRMAQRSMPQPREDVLMDGALSAAPLPGSLEPAAPMVAEPLAGPAIEAAPAADAAAPRPAAAPAPAPARPAPAAALAVAPDLPAETAIDYPVLLRAGQPLSQAALDDLASLLAGMVRPVRVTALDEGRGQWIALPEGAGGRFRCLRAGLLLADRQGVAGAQDLAGFVQVLEGFAGRSGVQAEAPDPAPFEARARALDALCADVDIAVGLSVVSRAGQSFQGTTIRALAEAAGMRLRADGQFHAEAEGGTPQFTLDNQGSEPFFAETLRTMTTPGVTFLLEVPRAAGGLAAYDRMVQLARQFARSLDGLIVDDNRRALDDAGLDATRRALAAVCSRMESEGIPPGGPLAQRLFG